MFSKVTKKVVATALILSFALSLGVVAPSNTSTAAPKLKIKKTISVNVGKGITLKANKKATWSINNKKATLSTTSGKSVRVDGKAQGKAVITAKAGSQKATCTVTIKKAAKGTLVYNMATETSSDSAPPLLCTYDSFKYSNFAMHLFSSCSFYQKDGIDYRGSKFNITLKIKNSGKRDLPELGFAFNYTKGGNDGAYPFALHVSEKALAKKVKNDKQHRNCKIVKAKIKKGKTYTYNFSFTIPKNAHNGDKDPKTGTNYPIYGFITNLKDSSPYKPGDSITILDCKIRVA